MNALDPGGIRGFNQGQDQTGGKVPLNRMFTEIKGELELALGKEKSGWLGLRFDAAIRLHDVLLSLRHWGDDIHNEAGVLTVVEGDKGDIDLATTVRSFIEDIARDMSDLWRYYEENDFIESTDVEESLMEDLENSVECLRAQVEPLRTFLDARNGSGVVAAVRKTAISRETQRHEGRRNTEDTDIDSAIAEQDTTSSLVINRIPISSNSQTGVSTPHDAELEFGTHAVVNAQPIPDALGLKSESEETRTTMTAHVPHFAKAKTKYIPHGLNMIDQIPYLTPKIDYGDEPRGYKGFRDFPAIWGYGVDEINISAENEDKVLAFLQSWLFFGLLVEACGGKPMQLKTSEFITWTEEGTPVITTKLLPKYHWYWKAFEMHPKYAQKRMTHARTLKACLELANVFFERVAMQAARLDAVDEETWTRRTAVLVSISTIAEWISEVGFEGLNHLTYLTWRVPSLKRLLHRRGWCVRETTKMMKDSKTTLLYYLSFLDRSLTEKNHMNCNIEEGCKALHTVYPDYKRRHITTGLVACSCSTVGPEIHEVATELERGNIPLVVASEERGFDLLRCDKKDPLKYVAVSHVWSHGLGNPTENRLNKCMFLHIQKLVNELYDESESSVPFWIDTICIPPQETSNRHQKGMRKLGIMQMADVYKKADKVLVLDQSLQTSPVDCDCVEAMIRVTYSEWSTRVWTLTEGRLGSELYFQFQDQAVSTKQMENYLQDDMNMALALKSMEEMSQEDIIANSCAVLLLRAIATPERLDAISTFYATLSAQKDSIAELRHLKAAKSKRGDHSVSHMREKWALIIENLDSEGNLDPEENLDLESTQGMYHDILAGAIMRSRIDPVIRHATDTIWKMIGKKGLGQPSVFPISNLRERVSMLCDICEEFRGRKTSRLDDETICLGILLRSSEIHRILDVETLPWRWAKVCKALGKVRITTRCHERRMKVLLSGAKTFRERPDGTAELTHLFPKEIIFWNVARLGPLGWNWAPMSLLDPEIEYGKVWSSGYGQWTPHGLEVMQPALEIEYVTNPSTISLEIDDVILAFEVPYDRHLPGKMRRRFRFHPNDRTRKHSSVSPLLSWVQTGLITQMAILIAPHSSDDSAIMVQRYHVKGKVHYTKHVAILETVDKNTPLEQRQPNLWMKAKYIREGERAWRVG